MTCRKRSAVWLDSPSPLHNAQQDSCERCHNSDYCLCDSVVYEATAHELVLGLSSDVAVADCAEILGFIMIVLLLSLRVFLGFSYIVSLVSGARRGKPKR
jgi:hypothetical protein